MNWDAFGAMAELAGAIAVVLTLFYLSSQIRQSNRLGRRNEYNATLQQFSQFRMAIAQDEKFANLYLIGSQDYEALTDLQKLQFDELLAERFWNFLQIWDRVQSKTMDKDLWEPAGLAIAASLDAAGAHRWWELNQSQFPAAFIAEIDSLRERN